MAAKEALTFMRGDVQLLAHQESIRSLAKRFATKKEIDEHLTEV